MEKLNRAEGGWNLALAWLSALEETARDFHGTRPHTFCERAYEHAVQHFLSQMELDYGIACRKAKTIREAVEEYIRVGVLGGAFADASQFELEEINPDRLDVTVHRCIYQKSCQALLQEGISLRDLTCARIGCFRAGVRHLADIDTTYEVTAFALEDACHGVMERK